MGEDKENQRAVDLTDGSAAPEARSDGASFSMNKSLTILAVDDDALILMNTMAILMNRGHRVTRAYSGMEALDILRGGATFDLLITDEGMPRMTGAELIETVRAERPHLPIVLATGYGELPGDPIRGVPRLQKPFMESQLLEIVQQAVSGGKARDGS
jgi:CheY-like chemotaxis protein